MSARHSNPVRCFLVCLAAALVAAALPSAALAQPLADRIPSDALLYVGWSGTESVTTAYNQSRLKVVVDNSDLRQFIDDFIPQLMQKAVQNDPHAAPVMQMISTIGPVLWRHPAGIYFGGLDLTGPAGPMPKFAIVVDGGADAAALQAQLQGLLAQLPPQVPVQCTSYGNIVALSIGRSGEFDALLGGPAAVKPAEALSARKEFKDELSGMVKNPVAAVFIDVDAVLKLVDGLVAMNPQAQQKWPMVRDTLGLPNIHRA